VSDGNEGSETVESENSQIVTGKDSRDCSNSTSVGPRVSDEDEYPNTVTDEDLGNASDSSADKVSSDGERSSSSNREFAGSRTRLRLSDVSGNASQCFSKTGESIFCSSRPSNVADELIERALLEMSRTDSSDVENSSGGEDSRASRDSRSEGPRSSDEYEDSGTVASEDSRARRDLRSGGRRVSGATEGSDTVDVEYLEIAGCGDSEITDDEGCRDSRGSGFKGSGVSDESEDSGSGIEWSRSEGLKASDESKDSRTVTGEDSRKGGDSRSEGPRVSEASDNLKTADCENSKVVGGEGSRDRREPRSDGSRVSNENEESGTASGKDSRQSQQLQPSLYKC